MLSRELIIFNLLQIEPSSSSSSSSSSSRRGICRITEGVVAELHKRRAEDEDEDSRRRRRRRRSSNRRMARSFCRRPRVLFSRFFFNPASLQTPRRHSHTSVLWEQLLGRKYEPSLAKALHDAVSQYKASQSVPSWLPFLPNSSFWVPSSEESAKCLQDLADRLNESDPDSDSESDIGCNSSVFDPSRECFHESLCLDDDDDDDYVDDGDEDEDDDEEDGDAEICSRISAFTAFQVTDKLLEIHRKSPIQQGTTVVLLDHLVGAGDVIDDTTEDDEDDYTDEVVVIDSAKE